VVFPGPSDPVVRGRIPLKETVQAGASVIEPVQVGGREQIHAQPPLNLVLFMMDDTGRSQMPQYDDLNRFPASYPYPSMPRLDGFVADGIRFTQARVDARCAPTRAAIFTGRQGHLTTLHDWGTGVGDVIANTPDTNDPFHVGITAEQNPWPGLVRSSGATHLSAMVGKYHLYEYQPDVVEGEGILSTRINPRAIVDEAGFDEGHECLRLGAGAPEYGFFNMPYTYTDADDYEVYYAPGFDGDLPPGALPLPEGDVFSPALMYKKATYFIDACVAAGKPFIIDWEMNLIHDLLPAMEPVQVLVDPANPNGVSVTLFTCYDREGLVPDAAGNNGETTDGGFNRLGEPDDSPITGIYGPSGQVHVEWRRARAMLEAVDTLTGRLNDYVQTNHPQAYASSLWMHYSDNGMLQRAGTPLETPEFTALSAGSGTPYYNCIPPTTTGEVSSDPAELYHVYEDAKGSTKDEGILTPLIVWGGWLPDAVRGQDCDRYVDACDFYPTILDAVAPAWRWTLSAADMAKIDGTSFFGSFTDLTAASKQFTHHCVFEPGYVSSTAQEVTSYDFSIVGTESTTSSEGYKFRRIFETGVQAQDYQMFNLATDPKEQTDVSSGGSAEDIAAAAELLPLHQAFFGQPVVVP
jgi:arylsulfatase A-like enzyme